MARVSVCVPTRKRSALLRETISSVLAQTYRDLEVIVTDNGTSDDDTESAVRSFNDARVRYHRNETDLGMVGNWNRGLEHAKGEYVATLHDDDAWAPLFIERSVAALDGHPSAAFAATAVTLCDAKLQPMSVHEPWPRDGLVTSVEAVAGLARGNRIYCPGVLVRRSAYTAVGPYRSDVVYAADWDMWLRLAMRGDVASIRAPLAKYRTAHGSMSDGLLATSEGILRIERDAEHVLALALAEARQLGNASAARALKRGLASRRATVAMWEARVGERWKAARGFADAVRTYPALPFAEPRAFAGALVGAFRRA